MSGWPTHHTTGTFVFYDRDNSNDVFDDMKPIDYWKTVLIFKYTDEERNDLTIKFHQEVEMVLIHNVTDELIINKMEDFLKHVTPFLKERGYDCEVINEDDYEPYMENYDYFRIFLDSELWIIRLISKLSPKRPIKKAI